MTHESLRPDKSISRRSALAALGGFLAWPAAVRLHERTIPEFSLAIVTDTHLGRDDPPGSADHWMLAAREIEKTDSEIILHLGDVVDNGREKQYDTYKDIRKTIHKPIHEIPGNHDPRVVREAHPPRSGCRRRSSRRALLAREQRPFRRKRRFPLARAASLARRSVRRCRPEEPVHRHGHACACAHEHRSRNRWSVRQAGKRPNGLVRIVEET